MDKIREEIDEQFTQFHDELIGITSTIESLSDRFDGLEEQVYKLNTLFDKILTTVELALQNTETVYKSNLEMIKQNEAIRTETQLLNENIKELIRDINKGDL